MTTEWQMKHFLPAVFPNIGKSYLGGGLGGKRLKRLDSGLAMEVEVAAEIRGEIS